MRRRGGPAGLALGLELARREVRVTVVEQSATNARSFRGESISPDSVWLLDRLGLLPKLRGSFLEMRRMEITDGGRTVLRAEFADFPTRTPTPSSCRSPPCCPSSPSRPPRSRASNFCAAQRPWSSSRPPTAPSPGSAAVPRG
ncbi:FAD-dependent monooxygenase [Streptacidiphilus monticola]